MKRLLSIDATRGLVMLMMMIDHARESFYLHAQVSDPVDVTTTDPSLFFTRICAHLCAPVFVALTGLAASLHLKKTNDVNKTADFLFKRGLILILMEITIINFGWTFSLTPRTLFLQVIWAIGLSMIALSFLIRLKTSYLITIGTVLVLGHNLLDPITFSEGENGHTLWAILHDRSFINIGDSFRIRTSYPILPWIGVMALGFTAGSWFQSKKRLWVTSIAFMSAFLILRAINIYGDTQPWKSFETPLMTIMSFLNLTKYPPSADFLLFTLSIGLFVMGLFQNSKSKVVNLLADFGTVPMFYYIIHIYLLNIINHVLKAIMGPNQGEYLSVPSVAYLWLISAILLIPMWYLCKWYAGVKRKYPDSVLKYI